MDGYCMSGYYMDGYCLTGYMVLHDRVLHGRVLYVWAWTVRACTRAGTCPVLSVYTTWSSRRPAYMHILDRGRQSEVKNVPYRSCRTDFRLKVLNIYNYTV